ncbi:flagellar biosynthesis protein FlhF [Halomonas saccharevitans]|uniref:Flagellar biosynthesis protein FlhF n=1 Tax=Halomonas saccharevitans TaxID=416872 RepID=A0ABU3NG05_9GAMM|nr:flagellar biosynthesis protein FlhF [Halomonas saccharevitans]MDT8879157.1 flagellar biosynthesis protein FlhF [Halomonas saccharevitans]
MSVIRFVGQTSREAMRQVRESLGDDALILANRHTEQGVEILAMADDAVEGMTAAPAPSLAAPSTPPPSPAAAPALPTGEAAVDGQALHAMSEQLLREMQDMRTLLAREQTRHAPARDGRTRLKRLLREAGFGEALTDELLAALPAELDAAEGDDERPLAWLQRRLASRLAVLEEEEGFFAPPGIVSLVGPTGVGKTTTTAKLAARFVQRHGADRVALITTDSFRIGAHEQLRIYAEILGIPMHALAPDQPIDSLAPLLRGRRWVIIDTVGMSQRDHRIIEQIAQLQGGRVRVRMVLLLNAASQPETLEEVASRYGQAARAAGAELNDCLLTKQDEAGRLAPAIETVLRHGLRLAFVSHGQRVPEDLALADPRALAIQALATRSPLPLDEAPATPRPRATTSDLLGQGRRLSSALSGLRRGLAGVTDLEAAWDLTALPEELQAPRLDALLERAAEQQARVATLWAPRRPLKGRNWAMPDLGLDAHGHWLALPDLQHRQSAGPLNRLIRAEAEQGVRVHLLPGLPDAETWRWLTEGEGIWSSQVRAGQRVRHGGERRALSELAALATPATTVDARLRGQPCRVALSRLSVTAAPNPRREQGSETPLEAWFAELSDPESGDALGRRFWLTTCRHPEDAVPLLLRYLQAEGVTQQTRRAEERLVELLPARTRPELRLLLAAGIATQASHLEHIDDEAGQDLRAELLGLVGGRRRRRDTALLEALLTLFSARDAMRQLGAASVENIE